MTSRRRVARWRRPPDGGFTLVESVVATTLFGIFAASLLTFVMGTFRMTVETQRRVTATHLATSAVAAGRALAEQPVPASLGVTPPTIDPTFIDDESTVDVGGVPYEVRRTSTIVLSEGDEVCGAGLSAVATPAALAEVVVEVTWPTGTSPVRLVQREALTKRSFVAVRVHDAQQPVSGVRVVLLAAVPPAATPTSTAATTDADGCAVFEVDPAADPAPSYWYAVEAGDASAASPQHVTADWRFSSGARPLGRVGAGVVRSAAVEVRREATLRFFVLDAAGNALTGGDTDDLEVTLVATDGLARDAEQVRSTAETGAPAVPDDHTRTSWQYPMRYRDVAPDAVWWTGGGAPVVTPSSVVITLHPVDQEVPPGEPATFEVEATGEGPLHVLWQVSSNGGYVWHDLDAGDDLTEVRLAPGLTLPDGTTDLGAMSVRAVVSNAVGHAVSATAAVRVLPPDGEEPPEPEFLPTVITVPPVDQTASIGDQVTFEVAAEGEPGLFVIWQRSTDRGLTWDDLTFEPERWTWETPPLAAADHGSWYRAIVVGPDGPAFSAPVTVSLFDGPRELELRALWPADYAIWVGSRPGALASVTLPPGGTVDVLLSADGGVVAVRDADGVVTVADGGAG